MKEIDKTINIIAKNTDKIRNQIVLRYSKFFAETRDKNLAIKKIMEASITDQILKEFGLNREIANAFNLYSGIVGDIKKTFGKIDPIIVNNLKKIDEMFVYNHVRDVGAQLTRGMVQAVVGNFPQKNFRIMLQNATNNLEEYRINALLNTTVRTFDRTVFADSALKFAPDGRYRYVGPEDSKNRDSCAEVLSIQTSKGFTIDEIYDLPVSFTDGGGFNCRHSWELVA